MTVIIVMLAGCGVLVGVSYLMLDVLSNMVVVPLTPVQQVSDPGEMIIPLPEGSLSSMQVSGDGHFIAYIINDSQGQKRYLEVIDPSQDRASVHSQPVQGWELAWLGMSDALVYEDQGDIVLLDISDGALRNLTQSTEYDSHPLPSPDGKSIMWTRQAAGASQMEAEFWLMDADGGDQRPLASGASLPVWNPSSEKILSRWEAAIPPADQGYRYFLQVAVDGGTGWRNYTDCGQKPLYLWWPDQARFYYVAPFSIQGQDRVRGVWFRVDNPESTAKIASTEGLSGEESYYQFYPSRKGQLLAYVGEKGLEYLDLQERIIYRLNQADARIPLAWDEASWHLYYLGGDGIYRVSVRGGGS